MGVAVGDVLAEAVGDSLVEAVGDSLVEAVGDSLAVAVGDALAEAVGDSLAVAVGDSLAEAVGDSLAVAVGDSLVVAEGEALGSAEGDDVAWTDASGSSACSARAPNHATGIGRRAMVNASARHAHARFFVMSVPLRRRRCGGGLRVVGGRVGGPGLVRRFSVR